MILTPLQRILDREILRAMAWRTGPTALQQVARGREISEYNLPGRQLAYNLSEEERVLLRTCTAGDLPKPGWFFLELAEKKWCMACARPVWDAGRYCEGCDPERRMVPPRPIVVAMRSAS